MEAIKYWGSPCKRHEHRNSDGKTLRYRKNGLCVACTALYGLRHRIDNNKQYVYCNQDIEYMQTEGCRLTKIQYYYDKITAARNRYGYCDSLIECIIRTYKETGSSETTGMIYDMTGSGIRKLIMALGPEVRTRLNVKINAQGGNHRKIAT